jgi:hypothetical protein
VAAVDAGLRSGISARKLARAHGLDYSSVLRHRRNGHVGLDFVPAPAGRPGLPLDPQARAAGGAREMLLGLIADLEARDVVDEEGRSALGSTAYVALQREKRLAYESLAKLEGPAGPPTFDPVTSSEWVELRECLFTALEPYPPALAAVQAAIRRLVGA